MQKLSGKSGMTRGEILDVSGMDDNATFVKTMKKMKTPSFMMILTGVGRYAYRRPDGIFVIPISCLRN